MEVYHNAESEDCEKVQLQRAPNVSNSPELNHGFREISD